MLLRWVRFLESCWWGALLSCLHVGWYCMFVICLEFVTCRSVFVVIGFGGAVCWVLDLVSLGLLIFLVG